MPPPPPPPTAAVVLAALCLMVLASPAAALVCNGGKPGYAKLDLVSTTDNGDALARCLTSFTINLAANCTVSVTALAAGSSFVDAVWSSYPERTYAQYQACPEGEGARLLPATMGDIPTLVRRAISEHVYGAAKPLDLVAATGLAYAATGGRYKALVRYKAHPPLQKGSLTFPRVRATSIPPRAGYKIKDSTYATIVLCEAGKVSFWNEAYTTRYPSGAGTQPFECIACSALDAALQGIPKFAHTYAPRQGMLSCIACPAGTIPKDTSGATVSCQPCGPGTYRSGNSISASCLPCGAGREVGPYSNQDCAACRAGTYMDGAMLADKENFCAPCQENYYRTTTGAASCVPCPRGTEAQGTGNTECVKCTVGYYNNREGDPCAAAPAGTFVNTAGAYIPSSCPRGTFVDDVGQDSCLPCPPGKYSNTFGSKECKTCAAGTFSQGQATFCKPCGAGYFSVPGNSACKPCAPGTFAPTLAAAACRPCPKGFQCSTRALKAVEGCPGGTYSNKEGNMKCTPCPANTYSVGGTPTTSVTACIKCPRGTSTRGFTGQSVCQRIRPQAR